MGFGNIFKIMTTLEFIMTRVPTGHNARPPFEIPGTRHKDFLEWIRDLGFTKGAEIGVESGIFSEEICKTNTQLTLNCIDPWKAYSGYIEHPTQVELDKLYTEAVTRLKSYKCNIIRSYSEDACKLFDEESLDFVYIDGNHEFLHVAQDISNWSTKVKTGGIVAGHDFRRNSKKYINDVKDVVPAYAYAKRINPWFVLREPVEASTWFWVKT